MHNRARGCTSIITTALTCYRRDFHSQDAAAAATTTTDSHAKKIVTSQPLSSSSSSSSMSTSTSAEHHRRWNESFDRIFIINLDRRVERMTFVLESLQRAGLESPHPLVERFSAVDGSKMDARALARHGFLTPLGLMRVLEPAENKIWGMDLNAGALGCAMSHICLWSRIAAERLERALVIEDDSIFPPSFLNDFALRMKHVPLDWELVYVSGLDTEKKAPYLRVVNNTAGGGDDYDGSGSSAAATTAMISRVPRFHRTTNCYLINHKGARSLLESCVPFTFQLDTQMTMQTAVDGVTGELYSVTPQHCYTMQPPIVVQATRFGSDIQQQQHQQQAMSVAPNDDDDEERARCNAAGWSIAPP